jgi:hypothetical protein
MPLLFEGVGSELAIGSLAREFGDSKLLNRQCTARSVENHRSGAIA